MELTDRNRVCQLMAGLENEYSKTDGGMKIAIVGGTLRVATCFQENEVTDKNGMMAFGLEERRKMYQELCDYLRDCGEEDAGKYIDLLQFQMWVDQHRPFSMYESQRKGREIALEELEKKRKIIRHLWAAIIGYFAGTAFTLLGKLLQ